MPIQVLSTHMASKIAAGEVVERPSSVVKELIENSIDAGSTSITIDVVDGGIGSISVVDNGVGIPPNEAALAFRRFATSKISNDDDLESVRTLGFRGEALPSIAAVAQVNLLTRDSANIAGLFVEVEEGQIVKTSTSASPIGTSVAVRHLFHKVPARLKFLSTPSSEGNKIQSVIRQIAMSFPSVRFTLIMDGKKTFSTSGTGGLRSVCSDIYGHNTAKSFIEIEQDIPEFTTDNKIIVHGLISPPDISRSNRSYIHIMVNNRTIQNRSLSFAVEEAYHGFLKERRHPLAVINIDISPQDIDINVHPAKMEVRFLREREVFSVVQKAVRHSLLAFAQLPIIGSAPYLDRVDAGSNFWKRTVISNPQQPISIFSNTVFEDKRYTPKAAVSSMVVIGQSHKVYIVADGPEGLFFVDQHAAHERVLYEKICKAILNGDVHVQGLLNPVIVEIPPHLMDSLLEHGVDWDKAGFTLDHFGGNSYVLRSVPVHLNNLDPGKAFMEILEEIGFGGNYFEWQEKLTKSLACHSAVRSGDIMDRTEMENLLTSLEGCDQPNTCPHGRPTMIQISSKYFEKEFGRI
jgi:DNA mismatch repair protein MutL